MKRVIAFAAIWLVLAVVAVAQVSSDAPASKEDVDNYLSAIHSSEMTKKMVVSMAAPMHQVIKDTLTKDKDRLPPDFEERMNTLMDEYLNSMPLEELQQAMIPIYQKHFTKGDLAALTEFYSSPTGQKILREMPAVMSEGMTSMLPLIQQQVEKLQQRMQEEIATMMKSSSSMRENKANIRKN